MNENIERQIIIGMIVSTDFLARISTIFDSRYIESTTASKVALWCLKYFEKYRKAPFRDIEGIFYSELKSGNIDESTAEDIETSIFPSLSQEFEQAGFNTDYYYDKTKEYFSERHLELYADEIKGYLSKGELIEAQKVAGGFKPVAVERSGLDMSSSEAMDLMEKAFSTITEPLIRFRGALGELLNNQLVRGGFVAFMAPEKRGKTWWLLMLAIRAAKQGRKIAFFQAGDMTEPDQLRRIGIALTGKSDKQKYVGKQYTMVKDCLLNQTDECDKQERTCREKLYNGGNKEQWELRRDATKQFLIEKAKENPDYVPCTACAEYHHNKWGMPFPVMKDYGSPLTGKEAVEKAERFFSKRQFRISTHANRTLSPTKMESILELWENEGFTPDVIVVDYADIMVLDYRTDERTKQNEVWAQLRGISQKKHALLLTVTQTDSKSYNQDRINQGNFSEDKRKYGHVTAMYGLNQDSKGREKSMGLMYINAILLREDDFDTSEGVYVLQDIKAGKAYKGSFY